jgi:hypothetical protein
MTSVEFHAGGSTYPSAGLQSCWRLHTGADQSGDLLNEYLQRTSSVLRCSVSVHKSDMSLGRSSSREPMRELDLVIAPRRVSIGPCGELGEVVGRFVGDAKRLSLAKPRCVIATITW